MLLPFFFFNDTATTEIYTLSLHDALPISRQDSVQDMAELVQQRLQLAAVEALGIEVRDQHAEWRAPGGEARAADAESRGVAVLALARKHIEVDPAQERAGPALDHVGVTDRGVPKRRLRPNGLDAVDLPGNREHPSNARIGREICTQSLLIDVVARALELFLIVGNVPAFDRHLLDALAQALGLQCTQFADFLALEFPNPVPDLIQKSVDSLRLPDHLPARGEMRVARQPVQARYLAAQTRRLAEQLQVPGRAPVAESDVIAAPRVLVFRVVHEGLVLPLLDPEQILALTVPPRAPQVGP